MSGKSGMSGTPPAKARHINAFPCPTWLSLCRAHVGHVGRARLHGASYGTDGRHGPDAARGRHGEAHATPGGLSLGGWLLRASCPACGLHTGRVWRLLKHSSRNHIFRVILGEISSEDTYNVLIGVHFRSFPTIFIGIARKPAIPYNRLPLHNKKSYPRAMRHTAK